MVNTKYPSLIALEDTEFTRTYSQFRILKATAWAVGGCGLLLGGLGVANTMIMSVFTRIREVAILRVNGFSHVQIGGVIFGESVVVSLSGSMRRACWLGRASSMRLNWFRRWTDMWMRRLHPLFMLVVILLALLTGVPVRFIRPFMRCAFVRLRRSASNEDMIQDDENRRIVLRAVDLWKSYDEGTVTVLKGVDLGCFEGRSVALCGPSGCGKSTLLHLFAGLDTPDRGKVWVNGAEVNRKRDLLKLLRHEIGFVFQLHNLIPDLTLAENCLIPTVAAGTDHRTARRG